MRMVECTKYGKERYLKIISDGHDFQDAMISVIPQDSVLISTTKKDLLLQPKPAIKPTPESI